MTYGAYARDDLPSLPRNMRRRAGMSQGGLCAGLLSVLAVAGIVTVYTQRAPTGTQVAEQPNDSQSIAMTTEPAPAPQPPRRAAAAAAYTGLLDPDFVGYRELTFGRSAPVKSAYMHLTAPTGMPLDPAPMTAALRGPVGQQVAMLETAPQADPPPAMSDLRSDLRNTDLDEPESGTPGVAAHAPDVLSNVPEAAADVPLPMPRPALLAQPEDRTPPTITNHREQAARLSPAPASVAASSPAPAAEKPSFFERLFGRGATQGTALAYATPDDGGLGSLLPGRAVRDQWTAVYNISTHTVTMPDGTQLEAHSGLGASLDDPNSVAQRMHGATPPNIYDLTLREQVFHGVRALRLTPVGNGETYGRGGLLAHTFMLGPRGDSNGCVVFRNYNAFLQAFQSGTVRRLMVVARG